MDIGGWVDTRALMEYEWAGMGWMGEDGKYINIYIYIY